MTANYSCRKTNIAKRGEGVGEAERNVGYHMLESLLDVLNFTKVLYYWL